jgi:hypothetical protein
VTGKVIAAVAIVLAGLAALLIVARPAIDPDLVVGYWQRAEADTMAPGPALIRIDRDGGDYTVAGVVSPGGEFGGLSEEFTDTVESDKSGISLKSLSPGSTAGEASWVRVRLEPSVDGSTLNVAIIPWEEDNSGVPTATWLFDRAAGDDASLAAQLEQQITAPSATPTP